MALVSSQYRYARTIAEKHGYRVEILDGGEGYLFRISDGERAFVAGAGALASYPLNSAFGASVARDKAYTNRLLDEACIPNLGGRPFFLTDGGRRLRGPGYELDDAREYFSALGNTAFCKPLSGSRGDLAERIRNSDELERYFVRCRSRYPALIMQRYFEGVESRIFVFDRKPVFCLRKDELTIEGDGERTAAELIEQLNRRFYGTGVSDFRMDSACIMQDQGLREVQPGYRPGPGESIILRGRKNVGFGGKICLIEPIPPHLTNLAIRGAVALGLRIAAVDLMETRSPQGPDETRIIEINSNPDIKSLELLDRWDLIEQIWLGVIRACLP